ncbi:MAG: phenylalanine--tRNA ligase subunit alpha [Cyclobacteriaceae bacterium]|nr:phenylalanine--tRNA ligase subunit alpha [Cyclobacteriaceae bacterium]
MEEKVNAIIEEIKAWKADTNEELEAYRLKFISRKSIIGELFASLKDVAPEDRRQVGQLLNTVKDTAQQHFQLLIQGLEQKRDNEGMQHLKDLTLPPVPGQNGSLHPLTLTVSRIIEIFERIGFDLSDGPEIEDDWHNFSALNFPENHPAREMQDTFFIEKDPDIALRTHTSSVQVRVMENRKPPIRTLSPGRVYRNEAISARAHCMFHQIEGLYIDENVSFADLKQTMLYFAQEFFGKKTKIRLRPSFFPFTEPSAELDIYWGLESESDYRITKGTGWLEIGGCGMVDPNVLSANNIDPERYTGFAFGVGVERIAMLKFQIRDIRYFTENDIRFLQQFKTVNF